MSLTIFDPAKHDIQILNLEFAYSRYENYINAISNVNNMNNQIKHCVSEQKKIINRIVLIKYYVDCLSEAYTKLSNINARIRSLNVICNLMGKLNNYHKKISQDIITIERKIKDQANYQIKIYS